MAGNGNKSPSEQASVADDSTKEAAHHEEATASPGVSPHPLRNAPERPDAAVVEDHRELKERLDALASDYRALHIFELDADRPWITEVVCVLLWAASKALVEPDRKAILEMVAGPRAFIGTAIPEPTRWQEDRSSALRDLIDRLEREFAHEDATMTQSAFNSLSDQARRELPLGVLMHYDPQATAELAVTIVINDLMHERERHLFLRRTLRQQGVPEEEFRAPSEKMLTAATTKMKRALSRAKPRDFAIGAVRSVLSAYGYPRVNDLLSAIYKHGASRRKASP